MAKLKINKTIEVCDYCSSDGYLQECIVCQKMYCLTCQCIIAGCWVSPNVCKKCDDRDDVKAVCAKYADKMTPIVRARDKALSNLPSNP
jgi:hypothetical protein